MSLEPGSRALVIGAGGGLGKAVAAALAGRGLRVSAAVRDPATLPVGAFDAAYRVDLESAPSIEALAREASAAGPPDIVVNAAGCDARKSLEAHSIADIDRLLGVDLRAPILVTRAFLPAMRKKGACTIMHFGGFADGRLAFPYYSADVAARAGLRSFVESMNRELRGSGVLVSYFSPAVADTEAERPFHGIWKSLEIKPASAEAVAAAAIRALQKRRAVAVMGVATRFLAALNAVAPSLADALLLRSYSKALAAAFGDAAKA